jgi:glycosyltransferase involved in cell wall biosynthesis
VPRILQICNTAFYLDRFLAPLVRELRARGHEVDVVCEGHSTNASNLGPDVRVLPFEFPRSEDPVAFARAIAAMRRLIRAGHYDLVDSHNRNSSIVGRVAAWLEHVPVNLYTAHGFYFHDDQSRPAHRATVALEGALARITDYTLSQSAEDTEWVVDRGMILGHRIEHIGNGIDTRRFRPAPERRRALETELGLPHDVLRVCSTGRLVRGKGLGDLLEAFARSSRSSTPTELVIIGGNIDQDIDSYAAEFTRRTRELGVEPSVRITGLTTRVAEYLAVSDIFVLPSYREGLPRALLEAMSTGLAVVATNIRGCREAVFDGTTGLLYEPHDVDRLASLLTRLYGDRALRRSLGEAAIARARDTFDERDYVRKQADAVARLIGENAIVA